MTTNPVKAPPHAIDAEQAVLGAVLIDPNAWDRIADKIVEEDFYRKDHRVLFRAIAELKQAGQACDAVTLSDWLQKNQMADDAGGVVYAIELANNTPGAANVNAYADIVREKSVMRQLLDVGSNIVQDVYQPEGRDARELLDAAERSVFRIAEQGNRGKGGLQAIRQSLVQTLDELTRRYHNPNNLQGMSTGFVDLDNVTGGLQNSDLVIVAARPSMGKTSFVMNIAEFAALRSGRPVAVFSMEMSTQQLMLRTISSLGRIRQDNLRSGKLTDEEWPKVTATMTQLKDAKLYIDDEGSLSPQEVRARARKLKRESGLGLVVIDYLQLMKVPGTEENRTNEISEISRQMKAMAKELAIPVIALSQLNRGVEQRADKRPMMSDLRESGSIEQDADIVAFIYRDDYYDKNSAEKGVAEIIIAKQRNGPTGTTKLKWTGEYTRFDNLDINHPSRLRSNAN
jgi:replicative DNA helicase